MAVAFDAKGTAFTGVATTSFTNTSLTIGSISNGVLWLAMQFGAAITSPVFKWDNTGTPQTMTLIGSKAASDNSSFAYIFALRAPHTGNKTLSGSWTGSSDYAGNMASFSGCDQTADLTTFKNLVTNASTPSATGDYPAPSGIAITTISGDMAVWSAATGASNFGTTAGLGTEIEGINTNVSGSARYLAAVGASTTVATNIAGSVNNPCCGIGCAIAAVGNIPASLIVGPRLRQYLRR